jgi:signal transduction histidine kinase
MTAVRRLRSSYAAYAVACFALLLLSSYDANRGAEPLLVRCGLAALPAGLLYLAKYQPVLSMFGLAVYAAVIGWVAPSFASVELMLVVAIFLVSWKTSFPLWATFALGVAALTVMYAGKTTESLFTLLQNGAVVTGLGVGCGAQTRRLRVANEQLVSLAEVDRRNAVIDERRRIARDLHDVAAHLLTATIVKSKLALRLDTTRELRGATQFAVSSSSDALDSIRTLVGVLSDDIEVAPFTPQPRVADVHELAKRMEAVGLLVDVEVDELPPVSRQVELAVVRIVQEGLTNVLRHRGPGRAWVKVVRSTGDVLVSIDDDGMTDGTYREGSDPHRVNAGRGLLGMRERATSCGGSLQIESSQHGGWRVVAHLPGIA